MTLLTLHSILRYAVLLTTLIVVIQSLTGMTGGGKEFTPAHRKTALFMLISCDLQLLAGMAVYFLNGHARVLTGGGAMGNRYARFYALEHPLSMLIGIVLVHVAYAAAKKVNAAGAFKFKRVFWYSLIALLLFVSQTPWPNKKDVGRPMVNINH